MIDEKELQALEILSNSTHQTWDGATFDSMDNAIELVDSVPTLIAEVRRLRERDKPTIETNGGDTLVRCPFCGSEDVYKSFRMLVENGRESNTAWAYYDNNGKTHYIRCKDCGATGGWAKSNYASVAKWNKRY